MSVAFPMPLDIKRYIGTLLLNGVRVKKIKVQNITFTAEQVKAIQQYKLSPGDSLTFPVLIHQVSPPFKEDLSIS